MSHHFLLFAGGAAAAGTVAGLAQNGILHKAAVAVTTGVMAATDAVAAETQSIVDDARDNRAEARRKAKIDAAVAEELAAMEAEIRQRVEERLDAAAAV